MEYTKKIFDSVHGFIHLTSLEQELIDTVPFQRLRYIRQLGITYLVYPGASHSRFEHSLGVMHLSSRIFERVVDPKKVEDHNYWHTIVRLAALCHDLGHLPFSHVGEKKVLPRCGHEEWTYRILMSPYFLPIWEKLQKDFPDHQVINDLAKVAIGESKYHLCIDEEACSFTPWEKAMSEIITGDVFGADRIDYLLRDAQCTGVSYGLFDYHQLIETLSLVPSDRGKKKVLELGIEENGITSCEALLLARYFMFKRVYQYASVKALAFHTSRFIEKIYNEGDMLTSIDSYLSMSDNEILSLISAISRDSSHKAHEDACCIQCRSPRRLAIPLRELENEKEIEALRNAADIEKKDFDWEFVTRKENDIDFPVKTSSGRIIRASECTDISLNPKPYCWVFLNPKQLPSFQNALASHMVNK